MDAASVMSCLASALLAYKPRNHTVDHHLTIHVVDKREHILRLLVDVLDRQIQGNTKKKSKIQRLETATKTQRNAYIV